MDKKPRLTEIAPDFCENAVKVLEKRYLARDEQGQVVETPIQMLQRVARTVAEADRPYRGEPGVAVSEREFYEMMARLEFLPNSPTLMNAGVVYLDGKFYYHAWPSVWLGKWVAVDPTFDQFPADATHISFVRGGLDRQVELMKIIGQVRIDVVNYFPFPGGGIP